MFLTRFRLTVKIRRNNDKVRVKRKKKLTTPSFNIIGLTLGSSTD